MKNIFLTLIIITFSGCKAQSPVLPLYYYDNHDFGEVEGAYYKDISNFNDQFLGTWIYTNGTTSLKVVLIEKPMFYDNTGVGKSYYVDYIIGEYKYIENGVEKVNTLSGLSNNYDSRYKYNLYSITQIDNDHEPLCPDCSPSAKRLIFMFQEPTRLYPWTPWAEFVVRIVTVGGVIKMEAQFVKIDSAIGAPSPDLERFSLPYGNYTLVKEGQPGQTGG